MIDLNPPWTAASQRPLFRAVLEAWARPGLVAEMSQWCGTGRAYVAVLAGLCDAATTLHDRDGLLSDGDRSRLGARAAGAGAAAFVLADGTRTPDGLTPARGSLMAPELGATVVLDCQAVGEGPAVRLSGPGIDGSCELRLLGVDPRLWQARATWCAFPLGVDLILCDARRIACIPRSTVVEV